MARPSETHSPVVCRPIARRILREASANSLAFLNPDSEIAPAVIDKPSPRHIDLPRDIRTARQPASNHRSLCDHPLSIEPYSKRCVAPPPRSFSQDDYQDVGGEVANL